MGIFSILLVRRDRFNILTFTILTFTILRGDPN